MKSKRTIYLMVAFFAVVSVVLALSGCASGSYYPVDNRVMQAQERVMRFEGFVEAEEFVQRGDETHTILFVKGYAANDFCSAGKRTQIEVDNFIVFVDGGYPWIITLKPTETAGVYTIESMNR